MQKHPKIAREGWAEQAIHISIHCDNVPCVGVGKAVSKSFDTYSWQSLLARGTSTEVKHYLCWIVDDGKVTPSPGSASFK